MASHIVFSKNLEVCKENRLPTQGGTEFRTPNVAQRSFVRMSELQGAHTYCLLQMLLQVITSGGITFRDQIWHKECFLCSGCRKELCEEAFMSRDDFPFCLDCYNHLYAKKCAACTKPITGKCFSSPWFYHDAVRTM